MRLKSGAKALGHSSFAPREDDLLILRILFLFLSARIYLSLGLGKS